MPRGKRAKPATLPLETSEAFFRRIRSLSIIEQVAEQKMRKCIHYSGLMNDQCNAGIPYDRVRADPTGGSRLNIPCIREPGAPDTCPKRQFPTREQALAKGREALESFDRTSLVIVAIREATKGKVSTRGRIPCPACKKGTVSFSVAYNGHIHANCSTPSCVRFIQ